MRQCYKYRSPQVEDMQAEYEKVRNAAAETPEKGTAFNLQELPKPKLARIGPYSSGKGGQIHAAGACIVEKAKADEALLAQSLGMQSG